MRIGRWRLRCDRREVEPFDGSGEARRLSPKALGVLQTLVAAQGRVVSKHDLISAAWSDAFVSDEALTSVVYELRQVLGDDARRPEYIQTIPRTGFRLLAEVDGDVEDASGNQFPEGFDESASSLETEDDGKEGAQEKERTPRREDGQRRPRSLFVGLLLIGVLLCLLLVGLRNREVSGFRQAADHPAPIRSVAVLPSGVLQSPGEKVLISALTEMLTTELAQVCVADIVPGIVVRERETPWGLEETRAELGVDAVAEGSILRYADRLWISVQLVDSRTGRLLWAGSWDRPALDEAAVLREIALEAAAELGLVIEPAS